MIIMMMVIIMILMMMMNIIYYNISFYYIVNCKLLVHLLLRNLWPYKWMIWIQNSERQKPYLWWLNRTIKGRLINEWDQVRLLMLVKYTFKHSSLVFICINAPMRRKKTQIYVTEPNICQVCQRALLFFKSSMFMIQVIMTVVLRSKSAR